MIPVACVFGRTPGEGLTAANVKSYLNFARYQRKYARHQARKRWSWSA